MDRSLLSRATDGSDAPTPGYLYNDIAKNAASSPVACSEIASYLTRRLASKNNPNIKYKCLKVIAKVSVDPITRGQLKRAVSQDPSAVGAIKEALQFRGPQDPARGDLLNERVRTSAKEALDAIYSDTPVEQQAPGGMSGVGGGGRMSSSYGASPHAGASAPYSSGAPMSTGRMQGIGNPMYADPRLESQKGIGNMTIGEVVGTTAETIAAMVKDPLARNVEVPPPSRGHSGGGYGGGGGVSVAVLLCDYSYYFVMIFLLPFVKVLIALHPAHSNVFLFIILYYSTRVPLLEGISWRLRRMDSGPWRPIVDREPSLLQKTLIVIEMPLILRHGMVDPMHFHGRSKIVSKEELREVSVEE